MTDAIHFKIEGLAGYPLRQIEDPRGDVLHMLRSDNPYFTVFGEIYFSFINPGMVKAWKKHYKMTQRFAVPVGRIRLVVFDGRENSPSKGTLEIVEIGRPDQYHLVTIPPGVWYGFQGISRGPAMIANSPDIPHDPSESVRLPEHDPTIPYHWPPIKA